MRFLSCLRKVHRSRLRPIWLPGKRRLILRASKSGHPPALWRDRQEGDPGEPSEATKVNNFFPYSTKPAIMPLNVHLFLITMTGSHSVCHDDLMFAGDLSR